MHIAGNAKHSGENERKGSFPSTKDKSSEQSFESFIDKEVKGIAKSQLFCY